MGTRETTLPLFDAMQTYIVHFRKDRTLSPAERRCIRRGARGIWLFGDYVTASTPHAACAMYRRKAGMDGYKLRTRLVPAHPAL